MDSHNAHYGISAEQGDTPRLAAEAPRESKVSSYPRVLFPQHSPRLLHKLRCSIFGPTAGASQDMSHNTRREASVAAEQSKNAPVAEWARGATQFYRLT